MYNTNIYLHIYPDGPPKRADEHHSYIKTKYQASRQANIQLFSLINTRTCEKNTRTRTGEKSHTHTQEQVKKNTHRHTRTGESNMKGCNFTQNTKQNIIFFYRKSRTCRFRYLINGATEARRLWGKKTCTSLFISLYAAAYASK